MADGAPLIHEDWADYERRRDDGPRRNTLGHSTIIRGDAAAAMAEADAVVKGRYVADCSQGVPIEPRAIIAQWQGDKVTVWSSTQVPFAARSGVATCSRSPSRTCASIVPLLGGGFGSKCDFHFEGHVAALARAAAPPGEARLLAARGVHRARPPARGHGDRARDRREEATAPSSPAAASSSSTAARTAARAASSPRWPRCTRSGRTRSRTSTSTRTWSTRTTSRPSSIRAPTAPQACWAVEQHMDEVAAAHRHGRRRAAPAHADRGGRARRRPGRSTTRSACARRSRRRPR